MHVDPTVLTVVAGAVIPILVGVVTKLKAASAIKAWLVVALSAVSAVVVQVTSANGDFTWKHVAISFAETFVIAIAAHYGFYKPVGATAAVQGATKDFGIGPPSDDPPPAPPADPPYQSAPK